MSSAPSHDHIKCEPDLTPLLDMVLQLVMFFMLCANFIMEETNGSVELPIAVSAKSITKSQDRLAYINIALPPKKGDDPLIEYSTGTARTPMKSLGSLTDELTRRYKTDEDLMVKKGKQADWAAGKGRSTVILRADERLDFEVVAKVMTAVKASGYSDIQLRAWDTKPEKNKKK